MNDFYKLKTLRVVVLILCLVPSLTFAGIFDDAEARKSILDLKAKIDAVSAKLETKSDQSNTAELLKQTEELRNEMIKLRGLIDALSGEISKIQLRQQDFYLDLDSRLKKVEPKIVAIDGKEVLIDIPEQRAFDTAKALFIRMDYKNAALGFNSFVNSFPLSIYAGEANYWLGNAYFAQRDCKSAIPALQILQKHFPDHTRTPDAMLNIAACYVELKDKAASKKTLESIVSYYPNSEEAQTAKARLLILK